MNRIPLLAGSLLTLSALLACSGAIPGGADPSPEPPSDVRVAAWRSAEGSCTLQLLDTRGVVQRDLFTLPEACDPSLSIARHPSQPELALRMGSSAYRINLDTGSFTALPTPPKGTQALGYTEYGLTLFAATWGEVETHGSRTAVVVNGRAYPLPKGADPEYGSFSLASYQTPTQTGWKQEWSGINVTYEGGDNMAWFAPDAPEPTTLPRVLGDCPNYGDQPTVLKDPGLPEPGPDDVGSWLSLPLGPHEFAAHGYWLEGNMLSTPAAVKIDGSWTLLPGLPDKERCIDPKRRERFLLLCADGSTLHDLKTGELLWSGDKPCAVFWP